MPSSPQEFVCPACHRRFRWKVLLAGKRVTCKCGRAIDVPRATPDAGASDPDPTDTHTPGKTYELAAAQVGPVGEPHVKCPSCGQLIHSGAVLCVHCGYTFSTGRNLKTNTDDEE